MTPAELLAHLKGEGLELSLNLKVTTESKPSDETLSLVREHRDTLLVHIARELIGAPDSLESTGLTLHGDLLHSLMVWARGWSELRLEYPGGVMLNAKPEHLTDAFNRYPWGVIYNQAKAVLVSWGDVPRCSLIGKRNLKTGALLVSEQVAA